MVIYPLSTVLHDTREKLGLLALDYILGEYYSFRSALGPFKEPAGVTADLLGFSSSNAVTKSQNILIREGFLDKKGDELFMNESWNFAVRLAQAGQKVQSKASELAKVFLETLAKEISENKITGALKPNPNNKVSLKATKLKIDNIIRVYPEVDEMALRITCAYIVETWGKKPEMVPYIRAATLLRSAKQFYKYYDAAQTYYSNKK